MKWKRANNNLCVTHLTNKQREVAPVTMFFHKIHALFFFNR